MVQILIHTADTGDHPTDQAINAKRFKPGDVVVVVGNAHVWGSGDLGPHNKLIKAPNITLAQVAHFLGQDAPFTSFSDFYARIRVWYFDNYASLPAVYNGTAAQLQAFIKERAQVYVDPDPADTVTSSAPLSVGGT